MDPCVAFMASLHQVPVLLARLAQRCDLDSGSLRVHQRCCGYVEAQGCCLKTMTVTMGPAAVCSLWTGAGGKVLCAELPGASQELSGEQIGQVLRNSTVRVRQFIPISGILFFIFLLA